MPGCPSTLSFKEEKYWRRRRIVRRQRRFFEYFLFFPPVIWEKKSAEGDKLSTVTWATESVCPDFFPLPPSLFWNYCPVSIRKSLKIFTFHTLHHTLCMFPEKKMQIFYATVCCCIKYLRWNFAPHILWNSSSRISPSPLCCSKLRACVSVRLEKGGGRPFFPRKFSPPPSTF